MSPAIIRRIEKTEGGSGWAYESSKLHCWSMPGPSKDDGFNSFDWGSEWFFGWTGDSLERWVTDSDRHYFRDRDYCLRTYFCPPGTVFIGHEQAIFIRKDAVMVGEESLI